MNTEQPNNGVRQASNMQPDRVRRTSHRWPLRSSLRRLGRHAAVLCFLVTVTLGAAAPGVSTRCDSPVPLRPLPPEPSTPVVYVALGDSTVYGIGATNSQRTYVYRLYERLRTAYPQTRLANLGVSGATAADVVTGQLAAAVRQQPALVTLSIGPNDITTGREATDFARDLDTILGALRTSTSAALVVNLIPDLAVTPRFRSGPHTTQVSRRTQEFNAVLSRSACAHGVTVVDLYTYSHEEILRHPEFIAADGYHPSDLGYARWAELMWKSIATLLP